MQARQLKLEGGLPTEGLLAKGFQGVRIQDKGVVSLPQGVQLASPLQHGCVCHRLIPAKVLFQTREGEFGSSYLRLLEKQIAGIM